MIILLFMIATANAITALEHIQIHQQCQDLCATKAKTKTRTCYAQCSQGLKNRLVMHPNIPNKARERILKLVKPKTAATNAKQQQQQKQKVVIQKKLVKGRRVFRQVKS